jgi:hypothetical protein
MHVIIICKTVQTGPYLGRKGDVIDAPEDICGQWIASKSARAATAGEIKAASKKKDNAEKPDVSG